MSHSLDLKRQGDKTHDLRHKGADGSGDRQREQPDAQKIEMCILIGKEGGLHLVAPEELPAPSSERARILIADDESDVAEVIRMVLERAEFVVALARDGIDAWRLVQEQPFAAVILDVDMPGLNGIEVCRRIKTTPRLADLPVLICSGRSDLADAARSAGAIGFIAKGSSLLDLPEKLRRVLPTSDSEKSIANPTEKRVLPTTKEESRQT